jgi:hypothetical protein
MSSSLSAAWARGKAWWESVPQEQRRQFSLLAIGIAGLVAYRVLFGGSPLSPQQPGAQHAPRPVRQTVTARTAARDDSEHYYRTDSNDRYDYDESTGDSWGGGAAFGLGNLPGDFHGEFTQTGCWWCPFVCALYSHIVIFCGFWLAPGSWGGFHFSAPLVSSLLLSLALSYFLRFMQAQQARQAEAAWEQRRANPPPRPGDGR